MEFTLKSTTEGQLILVDKPLQITSFQVVNKIRWGLKSKYNLNKLKVGHAGTLDPLASGLLIICTGKMTKKINELQDLEKTYTGTITLGATTASYDLETPIDEKFPISHLNEEGLIAATKKFKGEIDQYPPIYSAIKKRGNDFINMRVQGRKYKLIQEKSQSIILI